MNRPDESLFEDTKMSFGEHIEELRVRLFKAVIGVVIGFLAGLYLAPKVIIALQKPLKRSISEFKAKQSRDNLKIDIYNDEEQNEQEEPFEIKKVRIRPVELNANSLGAISESGEYPFQWNADIVRYKDLKLLVQKLSQPRTELEKAIVAVIPESDQQFLSDIDDLQDVETRNRIAEILNQLALNDELFENTDFEEVQNELSEYTQEESFPQIGLRQHLIAGSLAPSLAVPGSKTIELTMLIPAKNDTMSTAIQGPFMIWLKTGFIVGLVISAPWVTYQIWAFVAAGLYPHEKKYVYLYLPISLLLFISGAAFAFYVVFQYVLDFLFQFNASMGISPDPRVNEYIGFVMILPLGFGIAFQLPIVMVFLNRFGLVSIQAFLSKWRIAVLVIAIVSMLLTPQDPISMALMAIPLVLLYFVGILMCRFMPGGRKPFASDEVYDPS